MTWFFVAVVLTATAGIAWELRKRRRRQWTLRGQYDRPLPSVAAARKLGIDWHGERDDERDDVGLQLRQDMERKIAQRREPDYEADLAAIDEFARKRGMP